jgi:Apea-like HEPN
MAPKKTALTHVSLKARQRDIRDAFPEALALRVHRALSWLGRAETEADDLDVKFILLWVAFNAAYASEIEARVGHEREVFGGYFHALVALDGDQLIYSSVWERFSQEIRLLINNPYIFAPFWSHHNGTPGYDDHGDRLVKAQSAVNKAFKDRDTATLLSIMFDRLYVLRNQLVHGGATWNSKVNRDQVRDGAAVLATLVPIFINIMMDHPTRDWGKPFYPVVA